MKLSILDAYNLGMAASALSKAAATASLGTKEEVEHIPIEVSCLIGEAQRKMDSVSLSLRGGKFKIPADLQELSVATHRFFRDGDELSASLIYEIVASDEADRVWVVFLDLLKRIKGRGLSTKLWETNYRYDFEGECEALKNRSFKEKVLVSLLSNQPNEYIKLLVAP